MHRKKVVKVQTNAVQGVNYIIDVYKQTANSALSINAIFRGFLGASFPLFAPYMVSILLRDVQSIS